MFVWACAESARNTAKPQIANVSAGNWNRIWRPPVLKEMLYPGIRSSSFRYFDESHRKKQGKKPNLSRFLRTEAGHGSINRVAGFCKRLRTALPKAAPMAPSRMRWSKLKER